VRRGGQRRADSARAGVRADTGIRQISGRTAIGLYSGYNGKGQNHVELLYQRGERQLAMDFTRMPGCTATETPQVNETGSTYICCVHPDDGDRDGMNNVLCLSEIRAPQHDLKQGLRKIFAADTDLAALAGACRHKGRALPCGIPHCGLRFPSFESIDPVLDRLESCSDPAMTDRFRVTMIRPASAAALSSALIQAFVYTEIVATGLFCLGQVIELQAQRAQCEE
jgi:hypothetical protein